MEVLINIFLISTIFSVNFKKNEKIYNSANSEVFKMLQEQDTEPEPGNDDKFSHYYNLACMLQLLNGGSNIFKSDTMSD